MDMIATRIKNRLRSNWIQLRPVRAARVVGIGLPKTGTTSLGYCFRRFGFKHRTFDMDLAMKVKRNQIDEALRDAEKFEAFEDWPWFAIYRELDQRFPNSKFILTLRKDTAAYVTSLKGHHEREGIRNKDFVKPHWWDDVFGVEPATGITRSRRRDMKSTTVMCSSILATEWGKIYWSYPGKREMDGRVKPLSQ
jgi:hypothetical protein